MTRLLLPLLVACGGGPTPPTAESCAAICAADEHAAPKDAAKDTPREDPVAKPGQDAALSPYEQGLLGPVLDDLRRGVRPFDDQSVGLCVGKKTCDRYLGLEAKDLPPGDYVLQAVLAVPALGEGWTIDVATDCTTTKGEHSSSKQSSKTWELAYPGPDKGFKLVPLRQITSPGTHGAQTCTYTLTAPHPDGDKVIRGSWSVPE